MALHRQSVIAGLLAGLSVCGVVLSLGQGEKPAEQKDATGRIPESPEDMQKAMAAWMESIKPTDKHAWLEQFVGEWNTTMKIMSPGMPPMESKGKAVYRMSMGGRFLEQDYEGTMMGTPFTGHGVMGYDNNRKLYVNSWHDSMSTGIMPGKGNLDNAGKVLTMFHEMDEPMTGEIGKAIRSRTVIESPDTFTFSVDEVLYGEPFTVWSMTYERVRK